MEELRSILLAHVRRYPAMAPQDGVKLVYQNEFGGGHLVADPAQSLERLRAEGLMPMRVFYTDGGGAFSEVR